MPDIGTLALLGGGALLLLRRKGKTVTSSQAATGEPTLRYVQDSDGKWYAVVVDPQNKLGLDQRAHLASLQVPGYLISRDRTHSLVTRTTGPGTRVAVARLSAPPPGAITTYTGIRDVSAHFPSGPMGGTIIDEDVHNIQLAQASAGVLAAGLDAAGVLQAGIVTAPLAIVSGAVSLALGNPIDASQVTQLVMSAARYAPTVAEAAGLIGSPAAEVAAGTIAGQLISALPVIGLAAGFATQSPTSIAGSLGAMIGAVEGGAVGAFAGGLVALPLVIASIVDMLNAPSVEWMRFAGEVAKTVGLEQDINYKLANLLLVADNDAAIQAGVFWYNNQLRTRVGNLPAQTDPYKILVGPSTIGAEHGAPYDPWYPGFDEEIYVAGLQAMVNSARRGDPWQARLKAYRQAIAGPTAAFFSNAFGRLGVSPQSAAEAAGFFGGDFQAAYFAVLRGRAPDDPAGPLPGTLVVDSANVGHWKLITQADRDQWFVYWRSRLTFLRTDSMGNAIYEDPIHGNATGVISADGTHLEAPPAGAPPPVAQIQATAIAAGQVPPTPAQILATWQASLTFLRTDPSGVAIYLDPATGLTGTFNTDGTALVAPPVAAPQPVAAVQQAAIAAGQPPPSASAIAAAWRAGLAFLYTDNFGNAIYYDASSGGNTGMLNATGDALIAPPAGSAPAYGTGGGSN